MSNTQFKRHAIILAVIKALHQHESWTGKTHVQKALSLLHDKADMNVPFGFVLYRHGPYSFDVQAGLEEMRSYGAIEIEPNTEGYGVVLNPGPMADFLQEMENVDPNELKAINDVCAFVGRRNILELERLATASWIRIQEGISDIAGVADRLHALKPHVRITDAKEAATTVESWFSDKADD